MSSLPPDAEVLVRALAHLDEAIEVAAPDGRLLYTNSAWQRMTGYSQAEAAAGDAVSLLGTDEHAPEFYADCANALHRGEPWEGEMFCRRRDGSVFLTTSRFAPLFDADGAVAHVVCVRRDISAERASEERLRESEGRYERAVRGANEGLWEWDMEAGLCYLSPRGREILGFGDEDVDLQRLDAAIHTDDGARARAALDAHLERRTDHIEVEMRVQSADLGWRWVLVRGLAFRNEDGQPERVAGSVSDIQSRKDAETQLVAAATHDPLTGLPNRKLFVDRVAQAIWRARRNGGPRYAVLFVDLRRFKQVNDQHGHAVGDELLQLVAGRLRSAVRPGDTVARLGGDEFGVLVEPLNSMMQMRAAAERIEKSLSQPFPLEGRLLQIAGTVGAVMGDGASKVDDLIRDADAAMYTARADGRSGHHIADPEMRSKMSRRVKLAADFPQAIRQKQLRVAFQPIVDMGHRGVVGAEALARWAHPDLGEVSPGEFIGIAEDLGLGSDLGVFVLEQSVGWLLGGLRSGRIREGFKLHVNASARQLHDPLFVETLMAARTSSGIPRDSLSIEVTETVLVERPDEVARVMEMLKLAGVGFALDDFGTGWSSLVHLRRFPVQCIKIDRSFTSAILSEPATAAIVRGVASMANALGMDTVAEGVETESEANAVAELGCRSGQGYCFASPLDGPEAYEALKQLDSKRRGLRR